MQTVLYNKEGKEVGKMELPEQIFGVPWKADLVHQVVTSMQANARTPVAHTKNRGDVRGGGKKPWKQKGTGRARHGSRRSPLWIGGGVTFGPRNDRVFAKKINRKMRAGALYATLSRKLKDNELIFVDSLVFTKPKTKEAKAILVALGAVPAFSRLASKKNAALIAIPGNDANAKQSFRNIGNVAVEEVRNLNPVDVLSYKYVVVADPKKAIEFLIAKSGAKVSADSVVAIAEKEVSKKPVAKKAVAKKVVRSRSSKK
ncbi:MAG TPA: 50S ribosomal protein L4 [Candidatus Paceibacterota bacterium]|jgi:large subunit ribosomal protein L4